MNAPLFILLVAVIAILIWLYLRNPKSGSNPPVWTDGDRQDRRIFLEEIKTVFAGAKTNEQRRRFVAGNLDKILAASQYEDFYVEYRQLERQYGI
jgi:hypothetical protein